MYKSSPYPAPEYQPHPLASGKKTYNRIQDYLAKYLSTESLGGMRDLTGYGLLNEVSYLAEKTSAYKFKGRYVKPYCDFGAKKIFGDKEILTSFYNHLLQGYTVINELNHTPTEALGITKEDRSAIFDVSSRNEKGERFILEMQNDY